MNLDGTGAGEGALIAEDEVTAADDRQAGVRARAREERGGVTRTDQVHLAGDRARESAVTVGREVDEGGTRVRERAGLVRLLARAAEFVHHLRLIAQVDDGVKSLDTQVRPLAAGGVRKDGEGIRRTRVQVHPTLVDRKAVGGTEVGRRVEVEQTVATLHEAAGSTETEGATRVEVQRGTEEHVAEHRRTVARSERTGGVSRRTILHEEGRRALQLQVKDATAGAKGTEGGSEARANRRRTREGQGVDHGVRLERDRRGDARVLASHPAADAVAEGTQRGGVELVRREGAPVVREVDGEVGSRGDSRPAGERDVITDNRSHGPITREAQASDIGAEGDASGRSQGHHIVTHGVISRRDAGDRDHVAHQEAISLTGGGVIREDVTPDGAIGHAIGAKALCRGVREVVDGTDAQVSEAVTGRAASQTGEEHGGMAVAAAERADIQEQRLGGVWTELDTT